MSVLDPCANCGHALHEHDDLWDDDNGLGGEGCNTCDCPSFKAASAHVIRLGR